jgi:predicted nucleic acid-binding protein
MRCLVDTNVLVRFLVADHPKHFAQATEWFGKAEKGNVELEISLLVVAETTFVLESVYQKTRKEIVEVLTIVLAQPWITVKDRGVFSVLWKHYLNGFHFVDSWLLAVHEMEGFEVLSFDQKLTKAL